MTGLEPAASGATTQCSDQLSYTHQKHRIWINITGTERNQAFEHLIDGPSSGEARIHLIYCFGLHLTID